MANEIERKFLVTSDAWRAAQDADARNERIWQGYLSTEPDCTARVRIAGSKAFITIKGKRQGISRLEFEYEIPLADAEQMLKNLCKKPLVEKIRHFIQHLGTLWEVDEFLGENTGLVVAEVELASAEQRIEQPDWVSCEVTADARYHNSNLAENPFKTWHCKQMPEADDRDAENARPLRVVA